jgi:hypothetical protein
MKVTYLVFYKQIFLSLGCGCFTCQHHNIQ